MTTALTADQAFEAYSLAYEQEALTQGNWHGRDHDGRNLACALGTLGPDINSPRDCPAAIMPRWLAQMVPTFFDGQEFADAKDWGLRFYAELKRLDGQVPFSVVHDWQANVVAPLAFDWREKAGINPSKAEALRALHQRAITGDIAPRTEWFEALHPALKETYLYAYAYADAYAYANANADANADADANAYANANADAYADANAYAYAYANADAYAKKTLRQAAIKRLADGMIDCLSRVGIEP